MSVDGGSSFTSRSGYVHMLGSLDDRAGTKGVQILGDCCRYQNEAEASASRRVGVVVDIGHVFLSRTQPADPRSFSRHLRQHIQ